jgi:hypothetical protein
VYRAKRIFSIIAEVIFNGCLARMICGDFAIPRRIHKKAGHPEGQPAGFRTRYKGIFERGLILATS